MVITSPLGGLCLCGNIGCNKTRFVHAGTVRQYMNLASTILITTTAVYLYFFIHHKQTSEPKCLTVVHWSSNICLSHIPSYFATEKSKTKNQVDNQIL